MAHGVNLLSIGNTRTLLFVHMYVVITAKKTLVKTFLNPVRAPVLTRVHESKSGIKNKVLWLSFHKK